MALSDTFTPQQFYFAIQQGAHFHLELPRFVDAQTGEPFDFTADPAGTWTARLDAKTKGGTLVVALASSGENGVITLRSDGVVMLDLASTYTAALTPTADEQRSPTGGVLFADLVLVDPSNSEPWVWFTGKGQIRKQVTD